MPSLLAVRSWCASCSKRLQGLFLLRNRKIQVLQDIAGLFKFDQRIEHHDAFRSAPLRIQFVERPLNLAQTQQHSRERLTIPLDHEMSPESNVAAVMCGPPK